jgi:hypothetical protein
MRPRAVLLALLVVAIAAFGAGVWAASGGHVGEADRNAPPPPASAGEPVVALDPSLVDLRPDADLAVDWGSLTPPVAPLPSPGARPALTPAPSGSER